MQQNTIPNHVIELLKLFGLFPVSRTQADHINVAICFQAISQPPQFIKGIHKDEDFFALLHSADDIDFLIFVVEKLHT